MDPAAIDRSERWAPEWLYRPAKHKTARMGKSKLLWFGPQAQHILSELLADWEPGQSLFSTRDEPRSMRWLPGYTPDSLAQTVAKACKQAGVPHWYPRQLRAGRATEVEQTLGLEHAAATLGDRLDTTRHHYSRARELSRTVARQMG
jgi:integrase